jgi:Flp pilus assembly protein TadG
MYDRSNTSSVKSQALVETAIVLPIFILMLLGVFEVGWALRNYMVLGNADREAARVAARPQYLNFNKEEPGWTAIYSHTLTAISGQLANWDTNGTVIFTYIEVKATPICGTDLVACNCKVAATVAHPVVTTPDTNPNYTIKFPATSPRQSKLDYVAIAAEMALENNLINCGIEKKRGVPHDSAMVVAEMFYDHAQLVGLPPVTLFVPDPIPMYVHTAMRRETIAREFSR